MKTKINLKDFKAIERKKSDFIVQHIRGSGPGGQHRNKVATGVRIKDKITGLQVEATNSKSQKANQKECFQKLFYLMLEHYQKLEKEEELRRDNLGWKEKIRTYNEKTNLVKDHRTKKIAPYDKVLDGEIERLR